MSGSYTFLLVGCGHIGKRHAALMHQYGTLKAVCDINEDKVIQFAKQYNCKSYTSLQQMLEEVPAEVIAVCTPNGLHATHSIAALRKGFHVLCEKPMALTVKDCKAMIEAALQAERKLFVVKQNRFNEPVLALRQILEQGKLGKIMSVQLNCFWNRGARYYTESDWKGTMDMDGGILFTQFSHFIDLLYWYIGDVAKVEAFKQNYLHREHTSFEDCCVVILQFASGAIGTCHFTTCAYEENTEGSITLFGTEGTVKIGGQYLNILEYQKIRNMTIESKGDKGQPNDYGYYTGSMSNHDKMYEFVFSHINDDVVIPPSTYDAMKTVEIIHKIYEAANHF